MQKGALSWKTGPLQAVTTDDDGPQLPSLVHSGLVTAGRLAPLCALEEVLAMVRSEVQGPPLLA